MPWPLGYGTNLRRATYSKRMPEGTIGLANRDGRLAALLSIFEEGGSHDLHARRHAQLSKLSSPQGLFTLH